MSLHNDPALSDLLEKWNVGESFSGAPVAQRMFRDLEHMREFYRLAYPDAPSLDEAYGYGRVYLRREGNSTQPYDIMRSFWVLGCIKAKMVDHAAAAFLVSEEDRLANTLLVKDYLFREEYDEQVLAPRFLRTFRDATIDEIRSVFAELPWRLVDDGRWWMECARLGVPLEYLYEFTGRAGAGWSPERIGELYAAGVPSEYIGRFWTRPRAFDAYWDDGIPLEYALALDGEPAAE